MHKFKDNQGREWSVALDGWQINRLKNELGFVAVDFESIEKARTDYGLLANILFVLCESEAKERKVTDEDFGRSLFGQAMEDARDAYLKATIDFFPPSQQETLKTVLEKMASVQDQAVTLAKRKVNSLAMDEAIQREMAKAEKDIDALLAGTTTAS